ncbi:MAG: flavodoxin family protein [Prevotella sp.]
MTKRILILNSSPRKRGNVSQMLDVIRTTLEAGGAEVETIRVNSLSVHPCIGCMQCRTVHRCALPEDDAQMVMEKVRSCQGIVVGAPCYWGNMPGTLKLLFDRMVYGLMDESALGWPVGLHKGKPCVLVSTSTTPWPFNILMHQSHGAVRAMKEVMGSSGFRIVGTIEKGGTKNNTSLSEKYERNCRKAALRMLKKLSG